MPIVKKASTINKLNIIYPSIPRTENQVGVAPTYIYPNRDVLINDTYERQPMINRTVLNATYTEQITEPHYMDPQPNLLEELQQYQRLNTRPPTEINEYNHLYEIDNHSLYDEPNLN